MSITVTDLPIIFGPPMVRAELDDRKRMTRRLAKRLVKTYPNGRKTPPVVLVERDSPWSKVKPGDRLWVREEWRVSKKWDSTKPADLPPRTMSVLFTAGGSIANTAAGWAPDLSYPPVGVIVPWAGRRRASMHMPRWASRLTLIVTAVKIEPLQDISDEDIVAEGAKEAFSQETAAIPGPAAYMAWQEKAFYAWRDLWVSINGQDSWNDNPEVVAISFDVIKANIDAIARAA
ncbi:hypothetical protein [Bradyrhizobium cenepequi]